MRLVASQAALRDASKALSGAPRLYVDTEFEATREKTTLSLVQVSRGDEVFVVDALALGRLTPLRDAFGAPDCEWVLHAAQQDLPLLCAALDLGAAPRVFDTQVAWALTGPETNVSLAYLEYRLLGVRRQKSFQADDWIRRPLPKPQLDYAAADVEHLPAMRDRLGRELGALGREALAYRVCEDVLGGEREEAPELSLDSFRNAWQLEPPNQAALRYLVEWHRALPPGERAHAPEPRTLLAIASRLPSNGTELTRIKGLPRQLHGERAERLVTELRRAADSARTEDFVLLEPQPYATWEDVRVDGWLSWLRAELSRQLSVAPELLLPGRLLRELRRTLRTGGGPEAASAALSGWRRELVGDALTRAWDRLPPPAVS